MHRGIECFMPEGSEGLALAGLLSVGGPAFSQVPKEAKDEAAKALSSITMRCPSGRIFVGPMAGGLSCKQATPGVAVKECQSFIELKDVTYPDPTKEKLSPADVANGIEMRYHSVIKYPIRRYRYVADGRWDKWRPWENSLSDFNAATANQDLFGAGSAVYMVDAQLLYEGFYLTRQDGTWSSKLVVAPFSFDVSGKANGASCTDMENDEAHLSDSRMFKNHEIPTMADGFRPDPILRQGGQGGNSCAEGAVLCNRRVCEHAGGDP